MDLATVREELGAAADAVAGLTGYARRPSVPEFPCAIVAPPASVDYHRTRSGGAQIEAVVTVYDTPRDSHEAADARLDGWLSTGNVGSLVDAIEAVVSDDIREAVCTSATNWREDELSDPTGTKQPVPLLAADLTIRVTTNP